jgi:hypothetical protein
MEIMDLVQSEITESKIQGLGTLSPRRIQIGDPGSPLHEPQDDDRDWCLRLPFCETFMNAYKTMCNVSCSLMERGNCYTYIKNKYDFEEIQQWLEVISPYVVIRDCLALSFALDFRTRRGEPSESETEVAKLRRQAKTYGSTPNQDTYEAADRLVDLCIDFLSKVNCYDLANCVVAVPPSNPNTGYNLPAYLSRKVAEGKELEDLTSAVRTQRIRPSAKNQLSPMAKLNVLKGTIEITPNIFQGKNVLLIDDLYQSGVSINYVAMLLQRAGAKNILGLACEKTVRNDANI